MESDTRNLVEASGDDDIISLSAVSVDLQTSPSLSFNVKKDITKLLQELKRYENNPVKGCSCIGRLWNICSTSKDGIHEVIRLVNGHNLPQCLVMMLENLKSVGYFSNKLFGSSDIWNTSNRLFDCVCLFSKYSEEFCQSLVNSGILSLMVDNFEQFQDISLLRDNNSKPFAVIKATLCLVKNLARNMAERKSTLKKCFWTYLQRMRTIGELGVFGTLGEVFLCGREEIKRKTQSSETTSSCIDSLIYWINQSYSVLNNPTAWNVMFNLQDAICSLRILAVFGNTNHFCRNVVLDSLRRVIAEGVIVQDRIQTVLIIWTLCFDLEFFKLVKRDKIMSTLKLKEQSETDVELLHCLKAVLTIIKKRYIPRSVSFEGNAANSETYALIMYHKNDAERAQLLQTTLASKNVTTHLSMPFEENPKHFDDLIISIHKCHSVILCVSELTELDHESRTIYYMAKKLNRDVIAVFIQKGIKLNGWVLQELSDHSRFDFIESPFFVGDMADFLLKKSISFSQKSRELRNTRSLGSLTGQSMCSIDSNVSTTSSGSVFTSIGEISRQDSSGQATGTSLSRLSLSSNVGPSSTSSPISPSTISSTSSTMSFGSFNESVPEKFSVMTKKHVSEWLKNLDIAINIRDFKNVDGRKLWELVTTCQSSNPSDQSSYDKRMAHFKLSGDQKLRFTAALLKL